MVDFTKANYTAIISDLHLCEAEEVDPKYPLWKKYKTKQFFFDKQYRSFLEFIHNKTGEKQIELVLNGDIFDFDSVTSAPEAPPYKIRSIEYASSLYATETKSVYKIERILAHHNLWVEATKWFLDKGHRIIFVIGNHDLELHWPGVQATVLKELCPGDKHIDSVRFNEFFYISNKDTLIEHGNQYDPYCLSEDPISPYILRFNHVEIKIPFGNMATRYMINNMGFFNPHIDTNYIMTLKEYVLFFFKYQVKKQPFLMFTWFWWSCVVLFQSFKDRLKPAYKNPLTLEDKIEHIAAKSNATPRMVRELKELAVEPASSNPILLARELWLDRAFIILLMFAVLFQAFLFINNVYKISFFWMFIPLLLCLPFFVFYSRSVVSEVEKYKDPKEKVLWASSMIAKVNRIAYGHTHHIKHELIGPVEHLNSGTWSPAFRDVECNDPIDKKSYIWIEPDEKTGVRKAAVYYFENGKAYRAI